MTLIKKGAKGLKVVDIQRRLRQLGYGLGHTEIDGIFGDETEKAIKEFQKSRNISITGIMDDESWHELVDAGYSVGDRLLYLKEPPFRGDDVKILQFWLKSLGFYKNNENGIFNKSTGKALLEFQKNMKLKMDGILGGETLEYLNRLKRIINDKKSSNYPVTKKIRHDLNNPFKIILDYGLHPFDMSDAFLKFRKDKIKFCSKITTFCADALKNDDFLINMPTDCSEAENMSFSSRIKKANKTKADLFISINIGFDEDKKANIYKCNYFQGIKSFSRNGKKLADLICSELKKNIPDIITRSFGTSYAILKDTNMTAIYIEAGNMNNDLYLRQLENNGCLKKTGYSIANALKKFVAEDF